jgi:large subunit ribosomal protein L25
MDLAVTPREITGKKVRALRNEGLVPAVIYGHGVPTTSVTVAAKDFAKVFKQAGSTTLVTLVGKTDKRPVMIHEVSRDSVSDEIIHVDFHQVRMDETIKAKVPLEFIGESPAVKEKGAVLNKAMSEIEVEALPHEMPHSLTVDLSVLVDINNSIHVKDIKRPKGVTFHIDENTAVATANEKAPEEVAVVEEVVDVSAIKVEGEEKKAERQAEKAKEGTPPAA